MEKKKVGAGFGVMLLRNGKVLLGLRHSDAVKASSALHGEGTWTMPGGKLEFGESFEAGAIREVAEETGIKLAAENLKVISLANNIIPDAHFVTVGMLCERFSGEPNVMEPDEITKWQWFPLDALPTPVFFPSKKVLDNYAAKVLYKRE